MNSPEDVSMDNLRVGKKQDGKACKSVELGKEIIFYVNGKPTHAYQGETIHAALICAGHRKFRKSKKNQPRGVFCGMGVCYECLVKIDNGPMRQACVTQVEEGMEVQIDAG